MFERRLKTFLSILLIVMGVLLLRALHLQVVTRSTWVAAAEELKKRFPLLQIRIYDAQTKTREDVELSLRGRARGWRYRTAPESVVRHVHSATATNRSPLTAHYNERNRLLTLTRHADRRTIAKALARYLLVTGSYARRDVVSPVLRGQAPRLEAPLRRLRALGGYAAAMASARLQSVGGRPDRE